MLSRPSSALHPETTRPSRSSSALAQDADDDWDAAADDDSRPPSPPAPVPAFQGRAGLVPPDARVVASKLAKVGLLLRQQGEPDALAHVQKSLHLDPSAAKVWASLAHSLVQDRRLHAALTAYTTAVANLTANNRASSSSSAASADERRDAREEVAARAGLATVCAQLGLSGRAAHQLLVMRASLEEEKSQASAAAWKMMAGPFELLCRRLMPGQRFSATQQAERTSTWQHSSRTRRRRQKRSRRRRSSTRCGKRT